MWQNAPGEKVKFAIIDTAATSAVLVVADTDRAIKVLSYAFVTQVDLGVLFFSLGTSASKKTGIMYCVANGGISSPVADPKVAPLFQTNSGESLCLSSSSTLYVGGHLSYYLESV
jgi:hypothetical protein